MPRGWTLSKSQELNFEHYTQPITSIPPNFGPFDDLDAGVLRVQDKNTTSISLRLSQRTLLGIRILYQMKPLSHIFQHTTNNGFRMNPI